jgi:hypothetical protein
LDVLSTAASRAIEAHTVAGLPLPEAMQEKMDRLDRLAAELKSLPQPEPVPTEAALIAAGTPVDKSAKEHERLLTRAAQLRKTRSEANAAIGTLNRQLSLIEAEERPSLIVAMRPLVDELIGKARPLVEILKPYAPRYEAGAIVRHASMEQVEAWRESEVLEARFKALVAYWKAAWNATTTRGGYRTTDHVEGFDHRWPDHGYLAWAWPERVLDARAAGRWYAQHASAPSPPQFSLMTVAAERPEAGFILRTQQEYAAVYYEQDEKARAERDARQRRRGVRSIGS